MTGLFSSLAGMVLHEEFVLLIQTWITGILEMRYLKSSAKISFCLLMLVVLEALEKMIIEKVLNTPEPNLYYSWHQEIMRIP